MSGAKKNIIGVKKNDGVKRVLTPEQRKRRFAIGGGIGLVIIILFGWVLTRPLLGSTFVPVCSAFAELHLLYPATMRVTAVDYPASGGLGGGANRVVRLYYTYTGAFGETLSQMIDCKFAIDPMTGQAYAQEIDLNRTPVEQAQVDTFNRSITSVLAPSAHASRVVPPPLPDDLLHLQMPYPY